MSWVKRVEAVLQVLKGSSIGEIELAEGEFEFTLRRDPGTTVAVKAQRHDGKQHSMSVEGSTSHALGVDAPLTGVYYSAPSPTLAPFVQVGDVLKVGQTIALIEAMKVFNEIQAEVAGRVVAMIAQSGDVVKKGQVLFQVESV
ncbi:biotin/lipoyl-binding protein [Ktedonobacteria bacterium brp13]|nr:biotin/lipoyl-binding protein [Ktedonobacteria bacterium brp13]